VEYLDLLKLNKEGYLVIHRIHKILEVYLVILKINLYKANKQGAFLDKIHNKLHNLVVYLVLLNQHKEDYLVILKHKMLEDYLVIHKPKIQEAYLVIIKDHNK